MTATVEMTASLDSRIHFSIWKFEFQLVIHSCLGLSSDMPICRWVDLSFSVAVVEEFHHRLHLVHSGLHHLQSISYTKLTVCARHGWWVHFRISIAFVMLAALSPTQRTTLFSTSHSFATLSSSSAKFSEVFQSMKKSIQKTGHHFVIFNKVACNWHVGCGGSGCPAVSSQANCCGFFNSLLQWSTFFVL